MDSISVPLQIKCSKFGGSFGSFFTFVLEQSNIISALGNLGNSSMFVFWQHKCSRESGNSGKLFSVLISKQYRLFTDVGIKGIDIILRCAMCKTTGDEFNRFRSS